MVRTYVGILGDPAKINEYTDEFYTILKNENSENVFHLIGASENDVNQSDVYQMYNNFKFHLDNIKIKELPIFPQSLLKHHFSSRIGLFPSQRNQVIKGPNFVFAPFPINSSSRFLRFKSKFTINIFDRFTRQNILPIAYCPIGGKAANRAKSLDYNPNRLPYLFYKSRTNSWFKWYYLEAGSGEQVINPVLIKKILLAQYKKINGIKFDEEMGEININEKIIVPSTIYGGGIRNVNDIDLILNPDSSPKLIPECIVIGNISEEDVSVTYRLIERVNELNS